jgi:hypothetical protein
MNSTAAIYPRSGDYQRAQQERAARAVARLRQRITDVAPEARIEEEDRGGTPHLRVVLPAGGIDRIHDVRSRLRGHGEDEVALFVTGADEVYRARLRTERPPPRAYATVDDLRAAGIAPPTIHIDAPPHLAVLARETERVMQFEIDRVKDAARRMLEPLSTRTAAVASLPWDVTAPLHDEARRYAEAEISHDEHQRCGTPDSRGLPCTQPAWRVHDIHDGTPGPYAFTKTPIEMVKLRSRVEVDARKFMAHVGGEYPDTPPTPVMQVVRDKLAADGIHVLGEATSPSGTAWRLAAWGTPDDVAFYFDRLDAWARGRTEQPRLDLTGWALIDDNRAVTLSFRAGLQPHTERRTKDAPLVALVANVPDGLDANGWRAAVLGFTDHPAPVNAFEKVPRLANALREFVTVLAVARAPMADVAEAIVDTQPDDDMRTGRVLQALHAYARAIAPPGSRPAPFCRKPPGLPLDMGEG